jgi:hypothetical protein
VKWLKQLRIRGGTIAILALVVMTGCGSSTSGNPARSEGEAEASSQVTTVAESHPPGVRAVRWKVVAQPAFKKVKIVAAVPYCKGSPKPAIHNISKAQLPHSSDLTVYVRFPPKKPACQVHRLRLYRVLKFRRSIRGQQLYDGSTVPPSVRLAKGGFSG